MVELARTSSYKRASDMLKRIGLGSLNSGSNSIVSDEDSTEDSMTFISGLTEEIPDMRDDSVALNIRKKSKPKGYPPLPPKPPAAAPAPAEKPTADLNQNPALTEVFIRQCKSEPRTPAPSVASAKQKGLPSKRSTAVHVKVPHTVKQKARPPSPEPRKQAPSSLAVQVELIPSNLEPVPRLLFEEVLGTNGKMVEDAIDRLARRCRKSEEIRDEAYRAGGHAIVVMAMRQWRSNEAIQAGGCRCITNMTCQFPAAKRSFSLIGGVETAIVAMQTYPDSQQVQGYGCGALMNIICGHRADTMDVGLSMADRFVNELDGIAIVVKAMTKFPKDTKIQLGGCGLFQNLAQNKSYIYSMMQEGAVAAVGSSLTSHPHDPNIKKAAGAFMKRVFE